MTINEFLAANPITLSTERTDSNPNMADSRNMDHWRVTLRNGRRRMSVVFSMGFAHRGTAPTVAEVLDCLVSDAIGSDQDFETWCADYGLDTDSRTAERTYKACARTERRLRTLLGDEAFEQFRSGDIERL